MTQKQLRTILKPIEQPIAQKAERNKTQKRNATKHKTDGNTKCETKEVLRKCTKVGKMVRKRKNAGRKKGGNFQ